MPSLIPEEMLGLGQLDKPCSAETLGGPAPFYITAEEPWIEGWAEERRCERMGEKERRRRM